MKKMWQRLGLSRYQADERYALALSAFAKKDMPGARAEIQAALELLPRHAEYHAALGLFQLEGKAARQAAVAFERALALDPYDMLANYGLGALAYREKNWQSAEQFFLTALAAKPDRAETQYYLAMACHRQGRNAEAQRWMEAAQARFTKAQDRRQRHCSGWLREFAKLQALDAAAS